VLFSTLAFVDSVRVRDRLHFFGSVAEIKCCKAAGGGAATGMSLPEGAGSQQFQPWALVEPILSFRGLAVRFLARALFLSAGSVFSPSHHRYR